MTNLKTRRKQRRTAQALAVLAVLVASFALPARAAAADLPQAPAAEDDPLPEIQTIAPFAVVMDYETGAVQFSKNGDELMKPASMAKLMTVSLLFEKLKRGELHLDDKFRVSEKIWSRFAHDPETSKMFVGAGEAIRIEDLIRGIIIDSGNDACAVVAENIAGNEEAFARLLNTEARRIGLSRSTFANSNGMPDPAQNVTPRELALIARHLIKDYPEYYHYFDEKEFTWNKITQPNRDLLLGSYPGADGLKTGHTEESGFGMTASAKQGARRVIVVVNGLASLEDRASEAKRLLDIGFREFKTYALLKPGDVVGEAEVWAGERRTVQLTVREPVKLVLLRRAARDRLRVTLEFETPAIPPIARGQELGRLIVTAPGAPALRVPVCAKSPVRRASLLVQLKAGLKLLMAGGDDAQTLTLPVQPRLQTSDGGPTQPGGR